LAISDLLLGVFCMPFTLIGQLLRDFIFGDVFCRLISFFQGKILFKIIPVFLFSGLWLLFTVCQVATILDASITAGINPLWIISDAAHYILIE
jgi:hypothetical protein